VAFETPKIKYSGAIGKVVIGQGQKALTLGGETCYPFHDFEGQIPNRPAVGMEVWDYDPGAEWAPWAREPFKDVIGDPTAWAKKCVEYGAEFICLELKSTDPNDRDAPAAEAAKTVKAVVKAVDVPVVVWGTASGEKDAAVLAAVAEACQGANLVLSPVEEKNHKQVGAQALAYKHALGASSPIDVNLAKQLNILLGNLGVSIDKLLIDPTTGGLGYGMEYCYSVMERIRMAALTQDDDKLMVPMINNIGPEVWKTKETKLSAEEAPDLGEPASRAVLMEAITAVSCLLAGSDALILRHPDTVKLVKGYLDLMLAGGASQAEELRPAKVAPLKSEALPREEVKAAAAKPAAKPAAPKPEAKPAAKPEPPKAEVKAEPPKVEAKPAAEAKPAPAPPAVDEAAQKAEEEAAAKARAESEARRRAEEEAARKKAEEEAKRKAEEAAAAKEAAEAKAKAAAQAKAEEELAALRAQRREMRQKMAAEHGLAEAIVTQTAAQVQFGMVQKMVLQLGRIHKRADVIDLEERLATELAQAKAQPEAEAKAEPKAAKPAKPKAKAKSKAKK